MSCQSHLEMSVPVQSRDVGLGTQIIRIGEPGANAAADPCGGA